MPLYICVKDKPKKDGLLPALIRTVPCEDSSDGEKTSLDLWVGSSPGLQNFRSALDEAWKDPTRQERVRKVICSIDSLYEPERGTEEYELYEAFAGALIAFMETVETDPPLCDELVESYRALYRKARCELALTRTPTLDEFTLRFKIKDVDEDFAVDIIAPGDSEEKRLSTEYYNTLNELAQDNKDLGRLCLVTREFLNFTRGVEPASDEAKHLCAFAEALLDFAGETQGALLTEMQSTAGLRPGIYKFILINESSTEQRKWYLDRFVAEEEDYDTEKRTFDNVIRGLKRDQIDPSIARQTAMFIAEYCLKVYDLDSAAKVLKDIGSLKHRGSGISRLLLKMVSSVYSKTLYWAVGLGVLLLVLIGPALFGSRLIPTTSRLYQLLAPRYQVLEWASRIVLYLFYMGAILLPLVVLYKSQRDKSPYFQLFFPRLFGATVIGFTPLVFDTTPWKIGCSDQWFTTILIGVLSYLASMMYLHVDAHKMLATIRSSEWKSIMYTTVRLFLIGLMQSVTIAVVVSTLLSPVVWPVKGHCGIRGIMLNIFVGPVGIYPALIFVWTGIALFIGFFAQLLWQAGRVTEPL